MPSHVRIFFWLSVAVVAYWLLVQGWYWGRIAPAVVQLGMLNDSAIRAIMGRNVVTTIFVTIPMCVSTLEFAWMAAFRHQNWARFAFGALVVFREIASAIYGGGRFAVEYYLQVHWSQPAAYVPTILLLAASIFIFTGNARTWFELPTRPRAIPN
jgi:hypothetical protein